MGLHPAFDVILAFAGSNDRFCQTFELIFVVFFRPLRKHGSVTNVDHSYRFIRDYEQNSIGSAIAGAKQHLTDRHVEVGAFRRERTAFGKVGERFDTCPCAKTPPSRGLRGTFPNVTIYVPKIGLGFWRDHDAIT
jgi:hypothetical protein